MVEIHLHNTSLYHENQTHNTHLCRIDEGHDYDSEINIEDQKSQNL